MGTIRLGKRNGCALPANQEIRPSCRVEGPHVCGWDIFKDNAYQSAANAAC